MDWNRFLDLIDDRATMFDTWDEWYQATQKQKSEFVRQGFEIKDIPVNPDELQDYCRIEQLPDVGQIYAQFVQTK